MSGSGGRDRSFGATTTDSEQGSTSRSASFQDLFGSQYFDQLFGDAAGLAGGGELSQVAGFNPFQTQGQAAGAEFATNQAPRSFEAANTALNQQLGGAGAAVNSQELQDSIRAAQRPTIQNFNENILPSIANQSVGAGGFGGSRQGIAEGIAARGAGDALGDISTRLTQNAYNQGVDAQGRALGRAGDIANLGLAGSNILQGIGGEQQGLSQAQLDNPFMNLARFRDLLGSGITLGQASSGTDSFGTGSTRQHQRSQGDRFSFNQVGG